MKTLKKVAVVLLFAVITVAASIAFWHVRQTMQNPENVVMWRVMLYMALQLTTVFSFAFTIIHLRDALKG